MLDQMNQKVENYLLENYSPPHEEDTFTEESQLLINC